MRDLERERAADALAKIQALDGESRDFKTRYRAYVDRFGGAVLMNGLGQALATELAAADADADAGTGAGGDDKRAHAALARNVGEWLGQRVYSASTAIMDAITSGEQADYVRAQVETLAWLTWHKKFCHASFPKERDE